jgi:hypothetical protein
VRIPLLTGEGRERRGGGEGECGRKEVVFASGEVEGRGRNEKEDGED